MVSPRTEKAVKKVIALKKNVGAYVDLKSNGNHAITFTDETGVVVVARITLQQIVGKRLKRRKVKK